MDHPLNHPSTAISVPHLSARRILALICVPVFLGSLDLTVVTAFLPTVLSELSLNLDSQGLGDVSWLLTSYLLAYSISLFVMGRASDILGRSRALAICLTLYVVGSGMVVAYQPIGAALNDLYAALGFTVATNIASVHAILVARVVAAFGAGAITSIGIAIVGDLYPAAHRAVPLGIVAAVDTVGWLIGAAWGGLVVQVFPWRTIFLINIPLVLLALFGALLFLRHVPQQRAAGGFDLPGFVLLTVTLLSLNIGLSSISTSAAGVSLASVVPLLGLSTATFALFIWTQRRSQRSLIDVTMFSKPGVAVATWLNLLVGMVIFIPLVSVPLLVNIRNLDIIGFAAISITVQEAALRDASLQTGLLMAAFTVPLAVASVVGGWLVNRLGAGRTTSLGLSIALIGFALSWPVLSLDGSYLPILGVYLISGLGAGLTFAPIISAILDNVEEGERGSASAIVLGVRMIGMTIATSLLSAYLAQRIIDLVVAVESGTFIFDLTDPGLYSQVYSTTYLNAALQTLREMAVVGAALCFVGLVFSRLRPLADEVPARISSESTT